MKILITTDWYEPVVNGVVTSVKTLAGELRKRGHEVKILTLSQNRHSCREGDVFYVGSVGVGRVYPQARLKLPSGGGCIRELLAWKPDIIHSQCEFSTFFLARRIAAVLDVPIVHTYHTIYEDYTHYFSPRKTWGKELVETVTRRLSRQVDAIIVPSKKIERILEGYRAECPLYILPSGIELTKFRESGSTKRRQIRENLGISPDSTVLLYVGRLAKEKNMEELIRYYGQMDKKATEKTVLLIVGDGPHRAKLETLAEETAGRILFVGMIPPSEVAGYYQAGDLFVSASTSETQGLTYAEALASGLPLLCRRDGCLDGVVTEGANGWQYEDGIGFRQALTEWSETDENGKDQMASLARAASEYFSAGAFGRGAEKIYEEVLAEFRKEKTA